MDEGRAAAESHLDGLPEPRRTEMRRLHSVIIDAIPDADVSMWEYGGPLIGYGSYDYTTSAGKATGRWFSVGLANRKQYISLFSMATRDGTYLVEALRDRFPGTKLGKSCLNISKPELVGDEAVRDLARQSWEQYRHGFRRPATKVPVRHGGNGAPGETRTHDL